MLFMHLLGCIVHLLRQQKQHIPMYGVPYRTAVTMACLLILELGSVVCILLPCDRLTAETCHPLESMLVCSLEESSRSC